MPAMAITAPARPRALKRSTPCATARNNVMSGTAPISTAATPDERVSRATYANA